MRIKKRGGDHLIAIAARLIKADNARDYFERQRPACRA